MKPTFPLLPPIRRRRSSAAALTLVEVMVATFVLAQFCMGLLSVLIQSRQLTEGSIRQGATLAIFQGHLDQLRGIDYADLPVSAATAPSTPVTVTTQLDASAATPLTLSYGTPPGTLPPVGTTPPGAVDNLRTIDVNNTPANPNDDVPVNVWVWITDLAAGAPNAAPSKSILMIYTWQVRDGKNLRTFRKAVCTVRSNVPSF